MACVDYYTNIAWAALFSVTSCFRNCHTALSFAARHVCLLIWGTGLRTMSRRSNSNASTPFSALEHLQKVVVWLATPLPRSSPPSILLITLALSPSFLRPSLLLYLHLLSLLLSILPSFSLSLLALFSSSTSHSLFLLLSLSSFFSVPIG